MKLAIMQPYLFPYIGYIQLMQAVDKFVFFDDVNFIKKGWINRNNILVNGAAYLFTVPLKEASQNKLIHEIYLSDEQKWRNNFLKTIEQAYKKAPYYEQVFPMVQEIILSDTNKITDLIFLSFQRLNAYLDINTELVRSSSVYQVDHLKGQERILGICEAEKATNYINPIGGLELYDAALFNERHIKLNFIKTKPVVYTQFNKEFIPWLSVLDLLFFNSKAELKTLLNEYELI